MLPQTALNCGQNPTAFSASALWLCMDTPPISDWPAVGAISPVSMEMLVVLPAPLQGRYDNRGEGFRGRSRGPHARSRA